MNKALITTVKEYPVLSEKFNDKKKVLVGGCFDIIHPGHVIFLKNARLEGEILIVLLESDDAIRKMKGTQRPVHTLPERAEILSEFRSVDLVIALPGILSDREYDEIIALIKPDVIAATSGDSNIVHKKRQAAQVGAKLIEVTGKIVNRSSSRIAEVISKDI